MSQKLKVFIAEDDVFISEQLKDILIDFGYEVTGIGFNYESSVKSLTEIKPDIAILDIKMHGEDQGFKIASFVKENLGIPFLFLTSFTDDETVQKAVSYDPTAYIVKPFDDRDIYSTLLLASKKVISSDNHVLVKSGSLTIKLPVSDILWVKTDDKYIEIHTKDKKYVERSSIASFLESVPSNIFQRTHRSYVVNIDKVSSFANSYLLINNERIPLSRTFKEQIMEDLKS